MRCDALFPNVPKEKSVLRTKLLRYFKDEAKADAVYENIIKSNLVTEHSFAKYITDTKYKKTVQGEPDISVFFDWMSWVSEKTKNENVFITNEITTTPVEFIALAQGFTSFIPDALKQKNISFTDLFSENINQKNIFNAVFDFFIEDFELNIGAIEDSVKAERDQNILDAIKNNKGLFFDAYNEYLSLNYNLKFDEVELGRDLAFDKKAEQFSPMESATKAVKLIIATTKKIDKETKEPVRNDEMMNFPELVNYSKFSAMIHQTLVDIPGDINLQIAALEEKMTVFPEVKQIIDQLNFYGDFKVTSDNFSKTLRQNLLRTQFVNHFNKAKYNYNLLVLEDDGIRIIDSELDTASAIQVREWENNFIENITNNPQDYTKKGIERIKRKFQAGDKNAFLKWLGVELPPNTETEKVEEAINAIVSWGMSNPETVRDIYKGGKKGVLNRLKQLGKIAVRNNDLIVELQHINPDGNLVYGISKNTFLTSRVKSMRYHSVNGGLKEAHPELYKDPYLQNSVFVGMIKDEELANEGVTITINNSTGITNKIRYNSAPISDFNRKDLIIERIHNVLLRGIYNFVRAADRVNENTSSFNNIPEGKGYLRDGTGSLIVDVTYNNNEAITQMAGYLVDEIETNKVYKDLGVNGLHIITDTSSRAFTLKDGTNIFDNNTFQNEEFIALSNREKIAILLEDDYVKEFLNDKINEIIEDEREHVRNNVVSVSDVKKLIGEYSNFDNIIKNYAVNAFFGNIENTKLYTGDPHLYKDGNKSITDTFYKRMSMFNSTKEIARVDPEMNEVIENLEHGFEAKYEAPEGWNIAREGSTIVTATIQDVESNLFIKEDPTDNKNAFSSEERNTIEEIVGENSGYNNIKEPDGAAFITLDEYRIMKIRYNEWEPIHEELYQKLLSEEDFKIEKKYHNLFIPDKSQYVGRLYNSEFNDYNILAGRKFGFMPLVPGMFKEGSVLDKINQEMLSKGIGMLFFKSASKFGYKSDKKGNPINKIYDDEGNYTLDIQPEGVEILDYSGMGNQLKLKKNVDEAIEITEATQKRKLILANMLENGEVDPEVEPLVKAYLQAEAERIRRAYNSLAKEMGFDQEGPKSRELFVSAISKVAKKQGFSSNGLQNIQMLKEYPYLEILNSKERVEQFVLSSFRNNVLKQKRKGESLVQVSNVGFEQSDIIGSRHDLKFYRKKTVYKTTENEEVTKEEIMLPMEVYSPLPKELYSYVSSRYNNGQGITSKAIERFNQDIAKDNARYEETGEMTNLTKMTFLVGFRIPNQAPSSSDVAKVKAYYPPYIGGMVVVPKALVVKTGSDFDIDKLNLYYPEVIREGLEGLQKKFIKQYVPTYKIMTSILEREGIGYDYRSQTREQLEKWFVENVLEADYASLTDTLAMNINSLYTEEVESAERDMKIGYLAPKGKDTLAMTDKELNNYLLETEIELTLHPLNWKQLLTPLETQYIENIRKDVNKYKDESEQQVLSDIFTAKTNIEKFILFNSGSEGIGIGAVQNTNHVLAQMANLQAKAFHDYFGVSDTIKSTPTEEPTVIPVKSINELVSKPELQFNFIDSSQLVNFEDATQKMLMQEKLKKKADELQETINCIWKA